MNQSHRPDESGPICETCAHRLVCDRLRKAEIEWGLSRQIVDDFFAARASGVHAHSKLFSDYLKARNELRLACLRIEAATCASYAAEW